MTLTCKIVTVVPLLAVVINFIHLSSGIDALPKEVIFCPVVVFVMAVAEDKIFVLPVKDASDP